MTILREKKISILYNNFNNTKKEFFFFLFFVYIFTCLLLLLHPISSLKMSVVNQ